MEKAITLPVSGLTVRVSNRRLKVRDNDEAYHLMGNERPTPVKVMAARAALVTTRLDGTPIRYEDILDWDEEDLAAVVSLREDPRFFQTSDMPSLASPALPTGTQVS